MLSPVPPLVHALVLLPVDAEPEGTDGLPLLLLCLKTGTALKSYKASLYSSSQLWCTFSCCNLQSSFPRPALLPHPCPRTVALHQSRRPTSLSSVLPLVYEPGN